MESAKAKGWVAVAVDCVTLWVMGGAVLAVLSGILAMVTLVACAAYQYATSEAPSSDYVSGTTFILMVIFYCMTVSAACVLPAAPASIAAAYVVKRFAGPWRFAAAAVAVAAAAYLSTKSVTFAAREPWGAVFEEANWLVMGLFAVMHAVLVKFVLWLSTSIPPAKRRRAGMAPNVRQPVDASSPANQVAESLARSAAAAMEACENAVGLGGTTSIPSA